MGLIRGASRLSDCQRAREGETFPLQYDQWRRAPDFMILEIAAGILDFSVREGRPRHGALLRDSSDALNARSI